MSTWNEPVSNYTAESEVKPEIFNELAENEKYLKEQVDSKIQSSQVGDAVIASTEATSRTNIIDSETLKVGFGKIRKWFGDLGTLAFKSTITQSDISGSISASKISGAVANATQLETARTIGVSGVTATAQSFDGTANIVIPITAVPASLLTGQVSIDSSGNSDTATKLKTARDISLSGVTATAVSFDGSSDVSIVISGIPAGLLTGTATISTTGNATTATKLATARNIGLSGVTATAQSFNGTAAITIPITAVPAALLTGTVSTDRLPTATASTLGVVKGGGNVTVNSDGSMTVSSTGSSVTVTARSGLGNYTNLDDVLNYISQVFLGTQTVTKIKANTFDAV